MTDEQREYEKAICEVAHVNDMHRMSRISKDAYYLKIAGVVSERSTCLRRHYGAVIVRDDRIVATGYNGAARGSENCCDTGVCARKDIPHGERYELCRAVHAEANAIMQAGFEMTKGATLYLSGTDSETGEPLSDIDCCMMCKRMVLNAGIERVVFRNGEFIEYCDPEAWKTLESMKIKEEEKWECQGNIGG